MKIQEKIQKLENEGWKYETNYNTGNHILQECLIKESQKENGDPYWMIKEVKNGNITDYRK